MALAHLFNAMIGDKDFIAAERIGNATLQQAKSERFAHFEVAVPMLRTWFVH